MSDDSKLEPVTVPKRRPPNAGKGRPKGSVNKTTASVKAALTAAFDAIGGDEALATWAQANPTEFYKLWAKMLPTELSGPNGGPIPLQDMTDRLAGLSRDRRDDIRAKIKAALEGR